MAEGVAPPPDAALVEGYRWAFYAGAALAVIGALVALMLIRAKAAGNGKSRVLDYGNPQRSCPGYVLPRIYLRETVRKVFNGPAAEFNGRLKGPF